MGVINAVRADFEPLSSKGLNLLSCQIWPVSA